MQPRSRVRLRRDLSRVPITGLALYRAPSGKLCVLAGEDSDLAVYEADGKGRLLCRIPVFTDQPVHGIHVQPATAEVLAWGACSVARFSAEELVGGAGCGTAIARATAPDWIYHGVISPFDASLAVLATAHNEAIPLRCSASAGGRMLLLGAAASPSRPMLFAAHLVWIAEDCVLVAGGTVFGHVLVWKHYLGRRHGADGAAEMLFNLPGHEGSVFGVDISPPVTLSDGTLVRLLASCSDDRTIRIWDITQQAGEGSKSRSQASQVGQAIDTGFGAGTLARHDDSDAHGPGQDSTPIAIAMGHASRIWAVRLAPLCGADALAVYSFGEDATAQRWLLQLNGNAGTKVEPEQEHLPSRLITGEMSHDRTFSLHTGKHLWSSAILVEEDSMLIATGGGDSQICLIEEPIMAITTGTGPPESQAQCQANPPSSRITIDVNDMLNPLASSRTTPAAIGNEIISRYDFLTHDQILVTTSLGRLLLGSLKRSNNPEWQGIDVDGSVAGDLKLCYVLKTISHGVALLCTTSGNLYTFLLPSRNVSHVGTLSGKVIEINCLSEQSQDGHQPPSLAEVLLLLHGNPDSHLLTLDFSTGKVLSQEQIRGLDPRFVTTSSAKINGLLMVGSRHGWLSILDRDDKGTFRPIVNVATRSRDAISAIVRLPSRSSVPQGLSPYILATSRDGKYRIYELERRAQSICLHLRHETAPPFGPMIVGAWFTRDTVPELVLYGFRSKHFVIWNETLREEVATIECGGAHRTFRLAYSESDPGRYRFAFTKASKLSLYSSERLAHRWLKPGTHGREIRALSCNGRYIATGAEDTTIRIWEYQPIEVGGQAEMRCVATMKAHVTGLQGLLWFEEDCLFSSAGNEEFFVWRMRRLESDYTGLAVFCEGVLKDKSADGDLRIMGFDVCRPDDGNGMLVTMCFSNSTLRTYRYSCDNGGFKLFAEGAYTGACFTQTRDLGMRDGVLSILTASTDGHLALWRAEPSEKTVRKHVLQQVAQLHQDSIKGMDMVKTDEGYRVFTGGDDNDVGITLVGEASGDTEVHRWVFLRPSVVRKAHAASVTGVVVVRQGAEVIGVSVSNDQRIKAWGIPGHGEDRIELLEDICSGVADPGDIAFVEEAEGARVTVMVGGVGIEAWRMLSR